MTNPAPWSIKGVDKETREKMKQMAMARGVTLADLLDEMLHTSTKMIGQKMSSLSEKTDILTNEQKHISKLNDAPKENKLQ